MTFRTTKEIESFNREVKQLIIDHATSTDRLDFIRERVFVFITNEEGTPFVVSETKKEFLEEQERKKMGGPSAATRSLRGSTYFVILL